MKISTLQDVDPISLKLVRAEVKKADVRVIVPAGGVATFSEAQDASNFNVDPAREEQFLKANEKPYEPEPSSREELKAGDLVMVRDWDANEWRPAIYEGYFPAAKNYPHCAKAFDRHTSLGWKYARLPTPAEIAEHAPKEGEWLPITDGMSNPVLDANARAELRPLRGPVVGYLTSVFEWEKLFILGYRSYRVVQS